MMKLYTNCLKNQEFDKEAPQIFCSEGATIADKQGASENEKFEVEPTPSKTDSSGSLCINASWHVELQKEFSLPYIKSLKEFLAQEKEAGKVVYPPEASVFQAFSQTPFKAVKVVIMGQDPYHGAGQAHGLSFSVPSGVRLPPSLKNIFRELKDDLGIPESKEGSLSSWAKQGVLLLNATLTVRSGEPKSHYGQGWERFTDAVIGRLLAKEDPIVFILWGKSAQEKYNQIAQEKRSQHLALMAAHPSPYSAYSGFFGSRPFSKTNAFLEKWGKTPINWQC